MLARADSTNMLSVPADTTVARVSTTSWGPEDVGTGASTNVVAPESRRCSNCFIYIIAFSLEDRSPSTDEDEQLSGVV